MTKRQSSLKSLVAIRASEYDSIAFRAMDFEGETSLLICCQNSGESASFFFNDAREAKLFAKRVLDVAEAYDE